VLIGVLQIMGWRWGRVGVCDGLGISSTSRSIQDL
jgi:hypothetical protein